MGCSSVVKKEEDVMRVAPTLERCEVLPGKLIPAEGMLTACSGYMCRKKLCTRPHKAVCFDWVHSGNVVQSVMALGLFCNEEIDAVLKQMQWKSM